MDTKNHKNYLMNLQRLTLTTVLLASGFAYANPAEIICTIKAANLSCQVAGKERKVMGADDVANFVDAATTSAYVTVKSRKGYDRTFLVDGKSMPFKRLNELKNSASISEIATAKTSLFNDMEKKVIKLSDELDGQAAAAEFVLYDPSVAFEKAKREAREMTIELEGFRKNRDKVCTSTPAFEAVSKANARLQQTLSSVVLAWQTPGTCMSDVKIYKDRDGSIDLRQLDSAVDQFKTQCKK